MTMTNFLASRVMPVQSTRVLPNLANKMAKGATDYASGAKETPSKAPQKPTHWGRNQTGKDDFGGTYSGALPAPGWKGTTGETYEPET
jgi:hypothetical protein